MANKNNSHSLHSTSPISEAHENDIIVSTREIFLHGCLDDEEDSGIDCRVSNRFLKNLKILESINNQPVTIHQYSIGGEWESGMMISMRSFRGCMVMPLKSFLTKQHATMT